MDLMPALPESIFDVGYLIFAVCSGLWLIRRAGGRRSVLYAGLAALLLGLGDAFHLVPRVLNYWIPGDWTAALGIGKLVTSVTMTLFYVLLEYCRRERFNKQHEGITLILFWVLAAVRIALCAFPQNGWTEKNAPLSWGIYRNIPFVIMGVLTVVLWQRSAKRDRVYRNLWLAVLLSFAFYLPVVLWAGDVPLMGMLMLPKTVMYIWIILMFRKAAKEKRENTASKRRY